MKLKWHIAQKIERLWWRSYLSKKEVDSYLRWKQQYWVDFLQNIREFYVPNAADTLLDLGCGPAGINIVLSANILHAIDPLIDSYENDLAHFSKKNYPKVRFYKEKIEAFSSEMHYQAIFCINVINHVADINAALENIHRLASVDSKIIVSTDCHKKSWTKNIFSWIPGDVLHPQQYTLHGYERLFTKNGFKIIFSKKLKSEAIFDYWVFGLTKNER